LFDMLMLTDTQGWLQGDENIEIKGVNVAIQKETERSRQLEFLQITANPFDMQIMGVPGRATVLRAVSSNIGLDGQQIVPTQDSIESRMRAEAEAAAAQNAATPAQITHETVAAGGQPPAAEGAQPAQPAQRTGNEQAPRENVAGG
jgi:hypothetical protein